MVAGIPSTMRRTPRIPKVDREPKPRIESRRSIHLDEQLMLLEAFVSQLLQERR
jgi:hypothetical protein